MRPYHREDWRHLNNSERYRSYEYVADGGWPAEGEVSSDPALRGQRSLSEPPPASSVGADADGARAETPVRSAPRGQGRRRRRVRRALVGMLALAFRLRRRLARAAQRDEQSERGAHSGTDASSPVSTGWSQARERIDEAQVETASTSKS